MLATKWQVNVCAISTSAEMHYTYNYFVHVSPYSITVNRSTINIHVRKLISCALWMKDLQFIAYYYNASSEYNHGIDLVM